MSFLYPWSQKYFSWLPTTFLLLLLSLGGGLPTVLPTHVHPLSILFSKHKWHAVAGANLIFPLSVTHNFLYIHVICVGPCYIYTHLFVFPKSIIHWNWWFLVLCFLYYLKWANRLCPSLGSPSEVDRVPLLNNHIESTSSESRVSLLDSFPW